MKARTKILLPVVAIMLMILGIEVLVETKKDDISSYHLPTTDENVTMVIKQIQENNAGSKQLRAQILKSIEFPNQLGESQMEDIENQVALLNGLSDINNHCVDRLKVYVKYANKTNENLIKPVEDMRAAAETEELETKALKERLALLRSNGMISDDMLAMQASDEEVSSYLNGLNQNEDHMAYLAVGTTKALKKRGIVDAYPLGINVRLKPDINNVELLKVDKRTFKEFSVNPGKVKLLTDHDESSYTFVEQPSGQTTIKIVDPEKFWEKTSNLVIQRKNKIQFAQLLNKLSWKR